MFVLGVLLLVGLFCFVVCCVGVFRFVVICLSKDRRGAQVALRAAHSSGVGGSSGPGA